MCRGLLRSTCSRSPPDFFSAASDFHCLHSPSVINDYDGVYKFLLNVAALEKKSLNSRSDPAATARFGTCSKLWRTYNFPPFLPTLRESFFQARVLLQLDHLLSSYCFSFTPSSSRAGAVAEALSFQHDHADIGDGGSVGFNSTTALVLRCRELEEKASPGQPRRKAS